MANEVICTLVIPISNFIVSKLGTTEMIIGKIARQILFWMVASG